jgi:photosystem II stability/assembly factor-like uncharacterized protein
MQWKIFGNVRFGACVVGASCALASLGLSVRASAHSGTDGDEVTASALAHVSSTAAADPNAGNAPSVLTWHASGPWGGTATSIAIDPANPRTILAGGRNSLLYRSTDGGAQWTVLHFPKRQFGEVATILIDPKSSAHYLVGLAGADRGGLFESKDGGASWNPVSQVQGSGVRALAFAPSAPDHIAAATMTGVFLSTNDGADWSRITAEDDPAMTGTTAVAFDAKDPDVIYVGTVHLPWKTTDAGKTWESIHEGMIDDSDVFSIHVDPAEPQHIYASACSGIYSSSNSGGHWRKLMGIPSTHRRTYVIRQDPLRPATIYAGTTLGLFRSEDAGDSWKQVSFQQVNWIVFDPLEKQRMYLALEGLGIYTSDDKGATMAPLNQGFIDRRLTSVTLSGDRLIAVEPLLGSTSGIFVSKDKGDTWDPMEVSSGLEGVHLEYLAGLPDNDKLLIAASAHSLYKSRDGGATWEPLNVMVRDESFKIQNSHPAKGSNKPVASVVTLGPVHQLPIHDVHGLYVGKSGTQEVIYAATDRGLLSTKYEGDRWVLANIPGTVSVEALSVSPSNDGRMVARGASIFFSQDYGVHWRSVGFPRELTFINEIALPGRPSSPWLGAMSDGLFESPDQGGHWYRINRGVPVSTFNSVVYNPSDETNAYAVTYGQLFVSRDGGASWSSPTERQPAYQLRRLWMPGALEDRLFALTNEFGLVFRKGPIIR